MTHRWGRWIYDPSRLLLKHERTTFEVDLERCTTAARVLDWVLHLAGRPWIDPDDLLELLTALNALLNLRHTFGPEGHGVHIENVRALVEKRGYGGA